MDDEGLFVLTLLELLAVSECELLRELDPGVFRPPPPAVCLLSCLEDLSGETAGADGDNLGSFSGALHTAEEDKPAPSLAPPPADGELCVVARRAWC